MEKTAGAELSSEHQQPVHASNNPQAERLEKLRRKKLYKLNKQLHGEMTKNVELHNKYNRAISILRKVNSQNQDLLGVLSEIGVENSELAPAPRGATLSKQQQDMFEVLNN